MRAEAITRLVGATIDVTEQHEPTSPMRKGQERFQSLVGSNDAIDPD